MTVKPRHTPGGSMKGEELREAILLGINEWWDRQDSGTCEVEDTSVVAAAIVEALGITRRHVSRSGFKSNAAIRKGVDALTTLLDAAEED